MRESVLDSHFFNYVLAECDEMITDTKTVNWEKASGCGFAPPALNYGTDSSAGAKDVLTWAKNL